MECWSRAKTSPLGLLALLCSNQSCVPIVIGRYGHSLLRAAIAISVRWVWVPFVAIANYNAAVKAAASGLSNIPWAPPPFACNNSTFSFV